MGSHHARKPADKKDNSSKIALAFFAAAGLLFFVYFLSPTEKSGPSRKIQSTLKSQKYEATVNRHLQGTNNRMEIDRQRAEVENALSIERAYQQGRTHKSAPEAGGGYDLSYDTVGEDTARALGRVRNSEVIQSPNHEIQNEIYNQQKLQALEEAERLEYARQFVENARRGGWDVRLSPDLSTVISVKPLKAGAGSGFGGNGGLSYGDGAR